MNRNAIIGAASAIFLLPSFVLTVIPTYAHDTGQATCMAFAVALLPVIPFAIRRAHGHAARIVLAALGAGLLAYNFGNALDALNRAHAAAVDTGAKLADLEARRAAIPPHAIATQAAVAAAQKARDAECSTGYAARCRARENELRTAERDAAATERALTVETALDAAKAAQSALAPIEGTARQTAAQLSGLVGVSGEAIAVNRPIFKAFIVEALGGFAPWLMVLVFGKTAPPKPKKPAKPGVKDSVLEWHKARIERRPGRMLRVKRAYADYLAYCKSAKPKLDPVNLTAFGTITKDELKVQWDRKNNRVRYIGIDLVSDFGIIPVSDELRDELLAKATPSPTVH